MKYPEETHYLQTSFFGLLDPNQTNCTALYDLAPRHIHRVERKDGSAYLTGIKREFTFAGELYRVTVTPARITGPDGSERDELPGEREQLVEDVIRRLAADNLNIRDCEQIELPFTIYRIQMELKRHSHTFSKQEIKEALHILNKSTIEITKVVAPGDRKPKPVVSASAFPVLAFRDENDSQSSAFVQLNPLLVQAIKSLAFEQINYDWMMQVKGPLARWIFKYISLMLTNVGEDRASIKICASEIARSFGHIRARWRATLAEIEKAIERLDEFEIIHDYVKKDIFEGKKKVDILFDLKFSEKFIADRHKARLKSSFMESEAERIAGTSSLKRFHPITTEQASLIKFESRKLMALEAETA